MSQIISTEFEIARLQKWIDRKSLLVFDHVTKGYPLPENTSASIICEQLSNARKAKAQLLIAVLFQTQNNP